MGGNGGYNGGGGKALAAIGNYKGPISAVAAFVALAMYLGGILSDIQTDLNRNCDATADLGKAVIGVVSVDDELSEPKNKALRDDLVRQLRTQEDDCK